jgi:hypothetical protein
LSALRIRWSISTRRARQHRRVQKHPGPNKAILFVRRIQAHDIADPTLKRELALHHAIARLFKHLCGKIHHGDVQSLPRKKIASRPPPPRIRVRPACAET